MAETYQELKKLSDEELIESYDRLAKGIDFLDDFHLKELFRRYQERQTKWIMRMTIAITFLTALNVGVFLWYVFS